MCPVWSWLCGGGVVLGEEEGMMWVCGAWQGCTGQRNGREGAGEAVTGKIGSLSLCWDRGEVCG